MQKRKLKLIKIKNKKQIPSRIMFFNVLFFLKTFDISKQFSFPIEFAFIFKNNDVKNLNFFPKQKKNKNKIITNKINTCQ